jgi:DNA-binding beta-propeller fold protein YncE
LRWRWIVATLALVAGWMTVRSPAVPAQEPDAAGGGTYYVYVAAESQDEVALVRFGPEGTQVVRTIPVGLFPTEIDGPHGIAVDASRSRWYVSIAHGLPYGQVHAYAAETNERVGRVEVGLFPASISVTPGGLLFVANFNLHGDPVPGTVSVVDSENLVEVARITTCARPHGSRLSPDATRHYSVCVADEQLVEIDTRTLSVSRRLYVGQVRCGPTWAQPGPAGRYVYVACNKNRQVLEVDVDRWAVSRRFATGAGPYNLDVTRDGRLLVVTYKGAQATGVIDLASGSELAVVPNTRRLPHGVVLSPDSRYAFVSVEGVGGEPGTVDVIDLRLLEKVGSADVGKQAGGIGLWNPAVEAADERGRDE